MQNIAPSADFHRRRAAIAQNRPTQQRYRQAIAHFCGKPKSWPYSLQSNWSMVQSGNTYLRRVADEGSGQITQGA
ncbi:hypothetical protein [Manganibacter manganicus]|uniref:hypothetical protein n=1 Tax=Manganibacter manganicus TaxID=1873176 RepID=UPI001118EFD0|nr:hypothetical protein [Pseudaminobacter manganicus]